MIHFVVHEEGDSVGTIVVEDVKANTSLVGWIMEEDKTLNLPTISDIPIGHKTDGYIAPLQISPDRLKHDTGISEPIQNDTGNAI